MGARRDDADPGALEKLLLIGWLSATMGVVSTPIVLGVVAASLVPGLGGTATAVPLPLIAAGLVIVLVISVLLDGPLRRIAARLFPRSRAVAEEVGALLLLCMLLRPLMASWLGAVVAAAVAVGVYEAVEPVLDRLAARRRDASDG